jgi:hypothetical protein
MTSAVDIVSPRGAANSMTYVGVVIKKSKKLCARDMKVTLKTKNKAGLRYFRRTSLHNNQQI